MNRLRHRLLLVFLAATLAPLAATLWITAAVLDRSLSLATTNEMDELSRSLEATGRALFGATRDALKLQAKTAQPTRPAPTRRLVARQHPPVLRIAAQPRTSSSRAKLRIEWII